MAGSGVGGGRNSGGGGDNSVLLTVEVDAATGSLVVKNFSQLLGQLGEKAQASGEQASSSGGGWESLANAMKQTTQTSAGASAGLQQVGNSTSQATTQLDRMLLSVQKQAALFGKTGIDKMATQLGFLSEQYKDSEKAVNILTNAYGRMIGIQSEMDLTKQKNQLDQFISSLEKEAAQYGKTGIDALIAKRDQLLSEYAKEPAALAAITTAYGSMIAAQTRAAQIKTDEQEAAKLAAQKQAVDQLIGSLEKEAQLYGQTGIEVLVTKRNQLLAEYQKEPAALAAITAAYGSMISQQEKVNFQAQKNQLDQFISSLQKQAALFGASGVDKLIAERDQLLTQYKDEATAVAAITAAYGSMITAENKAAQAKTDQKAAAILLAQKQALDQFISSLQKQADLFGRSGIDKMEAERNQLLQEYKNEPAAINAITAAYSRMIEVQKQQDAAAQKAGIDQLIGSLQKQAEIYGKSGVDRLVIERNQLLQQYAKEPDAINAIQAAYAKMIAAEQAAGQNGNQPKWLEMFAQVELVSRAIEGFVAVARNLVVESTLVAGRVQVLNTVLQVTSRNMLISNAAAQAQVQAISQLNITQKDAIETVLQLERSQISLAKGTDLARAAQDLAVVSGQNSSDALRTIIEASQEHRAILLKQFGIVTLESEVFERYAASINKSTGALTEQEKTQAFVNEVLVQAQKVQGAYLAAMDDAEKKRGSLTRVEQEARVHLGQQFLPVMNEVVDALTVMGEAIAKIDPTVIKIAGTAVIAATAFVGLAGALAALKTGFAAVSASAFGVELVSLLNPVTAIIAGLAALGAALILFKSNTDAAVKETQELGVQAEASGKRLEEYNTKVKKAIDLENELASLHQNPNQGENGQLKEAQLTVQYFNALNDAKETGKKIDSSLVKNGQDQTLTSAKNLTNQQRFNELQQLSASGLAQSTKEQENAINATQQELSKVKEVNTTYQEQYERLKKNRDIIQEEDAYWDSLPTLIKKSGDEVTKLNNRLLQQQRELARHKTDPAQPNQTPADLQLDVTVSTLSKILELDTRINEARRQGAHITDQINIQQKQGIENAVGQIETIEKNLQLTRTNNLNQIATDTQVLNTRKSSADAIAKANADIVVQNHQSETSVALQNKLKELRTSLASEGKSDVSNREKVLAAIKAIVEVSKESKAITEDTQRALGNMPALREAAVSAEIAGNAANRADQERILALAGSLLQSRSAVLSSETQSVGVRRQQLDIEKQIAANALRQQILSQSIPRAQQVVLQSNLGQQDANRRLTFERELADSRTTLELDTDAKLRQAYGSTVEDQIEASNRRYGMERENFIRQYAGAQDLAQRLKLLEQAHQADLTDITDKGTEDRLKLVNDTAKQRLDTFQAGINERGFIRPEDLSSLENFYQKANAAELNLYQNSKSYQDLLAKFPLEALALRSAKEIDLNQKTQAAISRARRQAEEEEESRSRDRRTALLQGAAASGAITDIEAERQIKILDIRRQLADLSYKGILTAQEYLNLLNAQTEEINKQAKSAENRQTIDRAQTVLNTPGTSREGQQDAAKQTLEAIHDNQQKVTDLNAALESGAISWEQYGKEISMVGQTIPTIETLFEAIMTGAAGSISAMDALTAGFQVVGTAASAAFEAMGAGADAGKAVKNAFAGIFKELGSMAMKRSMFWLAAAIADTFALDPRAAGEYAAAAEWGAAAAVLGFTGGALSGGGSGGKGGGGLAGGSGGPNQAAGKAEGLQQIAPQKTQTDVTGDNIVRLSEGLVVQGRQIQAAGDKFNNLGGQIYQFINTEKQLANSQYQNQRNIADNNALQFDRLINSGGVTGPQFQALNSYFLAQADKVTANRDEGLLKVSSTLDTALKSNTDAVAKISNQGVSTGSSGNLGTQQTQPLETISNALLGQFEGLTTALSTSNVNLAAIKTNTGLTNENFLRLIGQSSPSDTAHSDLQRPAASLTSDPVVAQLLQANETLNSVVQASVAVQSSINEANAKQIAVLQGQPQATGDSIGAKILGGIGNFLTGGLTGLIGGLFGLGGDGGKADAIQKQTDELIPAYAKVQTAVSSLSASLNNKLDGVVKNLQDTAKAGQDNPQIVAALNHFANTTLTTVAGNVEHILAGIELPTAAQAPTLPSQATALNSFGDVLPALEDVLGNQFQTLQNAVTDQTKILGGTASETNSTLQNATQSLSAIKSNTSVANDSFLKLVNQFAATGNAYSDLPAAPSAAPVVSQLTQTNDTLNSVVQASVGVQQAINAANTQQIAALNAQPQATSDTLGDKVVNGIGNYLTGGFLGLAGGILKLIGDNKVADAIQKQTNQLLPAYANVQLAVSSMSASLNEKLNNVVRNLQETAKYNQDRAQILAALNEFTSTTVAQAGAGIRNTLSDAQLPTVGEAPDLKTQTTAFNTFAQNLSGIQETLGTQFTSLQNVVSDQTKILGTSGTSTNQLLAAANQKLALAVAPATPPAAIAAPAPVPSFLAPPVAAPASPAQTLTTATIPPVVNVTAISPASKAPSVSPSLPAPLVPVPAPPASPVTSPAPLAPIVNVAAAASLPALDNPDLSKQTVLFADLGRHLSGIQNTLGTQLSGLRSAVLDQTKIFAANGTSTNQLLLSANQKLANPQSPSQDALPRPLTNPNLSPALSATNSGTIAPAAPVAPPSPATIAPSATFANTGIMSDWLASLRTERLQEVEGTRDSFSNLSSVLSAKLSSVANVYQNGSQSTNDILRGIHDEAVKANEKDMNPIIQPLISIDGEPVAAAVIPRLTGNQAFGRNLASSVLTSAQFNSSRKELGRALSPGDV